MPAPIIHVWSWGDVTAGPPAERPQWGSSVQKLKRLSRLSKLVIAFGFLLEAFRQWHK